MIFYFSILSCAMLGHVQDFGDIFCDFGNIVWIVGGLSMFLESVPEIHLV